MNSKTMYLVSFHKNDMYDDPFVTSFGLIDDAEIAVNTVVIASKGKLSRDSLLAVTEYEINAIHPKSRAWFYPDGRFMRMSGNPSKRFEQAIDNANK